MSASEPSGLLIPINAQLGLIRTSKKAAAGIVIGGGKAVIPLVQLPMNEKSAKLIEEMLKSGKMVQVRRVEVGSGFREIDVFTDADAGANLILYLLAMKGKKVKYWVPFEQFIRVLDEHMPEVKEAARKILLNHQRLSKLRIKATSHMLYDLVKYLLKQKEVQKALATVPAAQ